MKLRSLLPLILLTGCVTGRQTAADIAIQNKLVGSWKPARDDVDNHVPVNYRADGTFDFEIKESQIACKGTWTVIDGHFEDHTLKSAQCPIGGRKTRDVTVSIDEHDHFSRAEDGILLHHERVEAIRPPEVTDTFVSKFAWPDQGQVTIREKYIAGKGEYITENRLSWTKDKNTWLFKAPYPLLIVEDRRATHVQHFPGKQTQYEVSADGHLVNVIDWQNDPVYLMSIKGIEPWGGPEAEAGTRESVERIWAERVQLWNAITIEKGKAKWKPDAAKILPKGYSPDKFQLEYKGRCSRSPQCVVLEVFGNMETSQATLSYLAHIWKQPVTYAEERGYRVELDFATLRPFKVSVFEVLILKGLQASKTVNSIYHRFYDWNNSK